MIKVLGNLERTWVYFAKSNNKLSAQNMRLIYHLVLLLHCSRHYQLYI